MSQISSINFKPSNEIQTRHNDRDLPPKYLIGGVCECNHTHQEALKLRNKMIDEAKEKYSERTGQKFQGQKYEWSAVVNLKPNSTMQDLEALAKHFNEKYGFQCYQIAIHRDEGHFNEQGEKIINHHAHLEFIMLDKNKGITTFKKGKFGVKKMREIQTEVAEILKMERGVDKRISKTKRIEPRIYALMKEKEKENIKPLKIKENDLRAENERLNANNKILKKSLAKSEIENLRKRCSGKGLKKEFFQGKGNNSLSALKKDIEANNISFSNLQDLRKALASILKEHRKNRDLHIVLSHEKGGKESLKEQIKKMENEIKELKAKNENLKEILKEKIQKECFDYFKEYQALENLKNENKTTYDIANGKRIPRGGRVKERILNTAIDDKLLEKCKNFVNLGANIQDKHKTKLMQILEYTAKEFIKNTREYILTAFGDIYENTKEEFKKQQEHIKPKQQEHIKPKQQEQINTQIQELTR